MRDDYCNYREITLLVKQTNFFVIAVIVAAAVKFHCDFLYLTAIKIMTM